MLQNLIKLLLLLKILNNLFKLVKASFLIKTLNKKNDFLTITLL
jgi:hypothetical protein